MCRSTVQLRWRLGPGGTSGRLPTRGAGEVQTLEAVAIIPEDRGTAKVRGYEDLCWVAGRVALLTVGRRWMITAWGRETAPCPGPGGGRSPGAGDRGTHGAVCGAAAAE